MTLANRIVKDKIKAVYPIGLSKRFCALSHSSDRDILNLEDLFGQVLVSGFMTPIDRQQLKSALLNEEVSDEHLAIINRLLYGVRRGFIKLAY